MKSYTEEFKKTIVELDLGQVFRHILVFVLQYENM